jgi:hypothetical protein
MDRVLNRDGWRCQAPACTGRANLEVHHVQLRSEGGGDEPDNCVTLCRFHHHRGVHDDLLGLRGGPPLGLLWRLGPAGRGVWYRDERRVQYRDADLRVLLRELSYDLQLPLAHHQP